MTTAAMPPTPFLASLRRRYEHICGQLAVHQRELIAEPSSRQFNEAGIQLLKRCRNSALGDLVTAERDIFFKNPPQWLRLR